MKACLRIMCFCFSVCCALGSGALYAQQTWNPVGSSDMRWTVFKLYNITLLTQSGNYSAEEYPQALEIRYYRDIAREDLVKATGDQWSRLGIPSGKRDAWLPELMAIWPDVGANDTLRFEVDASGANTFYFNDEIIGAVGSSEFSQAFLDIWLSPETSRPDLRNKLIGGSSENA